MGRTYGALSAVLDAAGLLVREGLEVLVGLDVLVRVPDTEVLEVRVREIDAEGVISPSSAGDV